MVTAPAKTLALVVSAIKNLCERKGSTSREISYYLSNVYNIPLKVARRQMQTALRRGVAYGILRKNGEHYVLPTSQAIKCGEIAAQEIDLLDLCSRRRSRRLRRRRRSSRKRSCKCKRKRSARRSRRGRCRSRRSRSRKSACKCKSKRRRRRRRRKCQCGGLGRKSAQRNAKTNHQVVEPIRTDQTTNPPERDDDDNESRDQNSTSLSSLESGTD